jgi:hypothetical protein
VLFREQHSDTAIRHVLFDVADDMGVPGEQFLHFDAVRYVFRRLSPAGKDDLRPVGLDLRGGLAREPGVEFVPRRRTFCLVDRQRLSSIGETIRPAQKDIRDLIFAERL